jgi:hypothetical protein
VDLGGQGNRPGRYRPLRPPDQLYVPAAARGREAGILDPRERRASVHAGAFSTGWATLVSRNGSRPLGAEAGNAPGILAPSPCLETFPCSPGR